MPPDRDPAREAAREIADAWGLHTASVLGVLRRHFPDRDTQRLNWLDRFGGECPIDVPHTHGDTLRECLDDAMERYPDLAAWKRAVEQMPGVDHHRRHFPDREKLEAVVEAARALKHHRHHRPGYSRDMQECWETLGNALADLDRAREGGDG